MKCFYDLIRISQKNQLPYSEKYDFSFLSAHIKKAFTAECLLSMNLYCTETFHTGTGKLPRFHPACFRQKTILIHVMITESPCRIKAAPRWYSVSRNIRILAPYRSLSEMTGQLTVLFNTFIIIFTLQRLFYIKTRIYVKTESLPTGDNPSTDLLLRGKSLSP